MVALPPEPIFESLVQAYTQPQRAYHTLEHVQDCLEQLDWSRHLAEHADEVEIALWFHDAVYDPHASDNEEQSAAWAAKILQDGQVELDVTARVSRLILATRHQAAPASRDDALIVDIDLSILGHDHTEFDRYEANIRREYEWVADAAYREARAQILESFLHRDTVFQTPEFQRRYEVRARDNLSRSIRKLRIGQ